MVELGKMKRNLMNVVGSAFPDGAKHKPPTMNKISIPLRVFVPALLSMVGVLATAATGHAEETPSPRTRILFDRDSRFHTGEAPGAEAARIPGWELA